MSYSISLFNFGHMIVLIHKIIVTEKKNYIIYNTWMKYIIMIIFYYSV
jgi:hypothetical protein